MANVISRMNDAFETWSFKYNCYEAVHPWTPYCTDSALELGVTVFEQAFKLYTPLYLRKFDYNSFEKSAQSILRSTTFISANAFFALLFFCSSQHLTGKFYYYVVAYLPAFLASSMAVMIEKPNRRSSLAFYVSNVASETLFRIFVGRGYIKPLRNGQVYIFTLAIATLMWLAKKHGFEDDPLSSAIKLIVGDEEAAKRVRKSRRTVNPEKRLQAIKELDEEKTLHTASTPLPLSLRSNASLSEKLTSLRSWIKFTLLARHRLCPHNQACSCLHYAARASGKALLIGMSAQLGLSLIPKLRTLLAEPRKLLSSPIVTIDSSLFRMGIFLSTFSGIFKLTNCWLRWRTDQDAASNSFLAGLMAGPTLLLYPSPTIALYVFWKCLEALFHEGVREKLIKNENLFIVIIYGLSTSQLFYSALMDPRYMKKSYMAFLHKMSKEKLHMVNRSVLDIFGTGASSGYEDFFPNLHPKFLSLPFMSSIWIWMIEQKSVLITKQII